MATGPGRYDAECTVARESAGAHAAILIVIGGRHGSGFSAQVPEGMELDLPDVLRQVADGIERERGL